MDLLETQAFVVSVVVVAAYEFIKSLVSKGLNAKEMADEAVWKQGVTDSLTALMQLTKEIESKLDSRHIEDRANIRR